MNKAVIVAATRTPIGRRAGVVVRPLSAAHALADAMGAQFDQIQAEALAAMEALAPAAIAPTVLPAAVTCVGIQVKLCPQHHTVPSFFKATVWYDPAAIATTPVSPLTCTGV